MSHRMSARSEPGGASGERLRRALEPGPPAASRRRSPGRRGSRPRCPWRPARGSRWRGSRRTGRPCSCWRSRCARRARTSASLSRVRNTCSPRAFTSSARSLRAIASATSFSSVPPGPCAPTSRRRGRGRSRPSARTAPPAGAAPGGAGKPGRWPARPAPSGGPESSSTSRDGDSCSRRLQPPEARAELHGEDVLASRRGTGPTRRSRRRGDPAAARRPRRSRGMATVTRPGLLLDPERDRLAGLEHHPHEVARDVGADRDPRDRHAGRSRAPAAPARHSTGRPSSGVSSRGRPSTGTSKRPPSSWAGRGEQLQVAVDGSEALPVVQDQLVALSLVPSPRPPSRRS